MGIKKRKDSFIGLHFDYHANPKYGIQGATLREEDIREICRSVKPDFIQIDCKGHPGWASYPSEIGNAMPEFATDTLALWRRVTEEEGVALYMHYSGVYDIKYVTENPDEEIVTADGSSGRGATRLGGKYVDDILIPQLSELAEKYCVDGVWVDGECWKATPDFRPESLSAFEKETGIDLGGKLPATSNDAYYDEYREYHRELFRRYLRYYVDKLHEKYPDFQIASNWAFSDHMPEKVSANVDFLSGDLNPSGSYNSARYAARALAQQEGYAWDLMSWNFRIKVGSRAACVTKHPSQIMQEAAIITALGGAYQNYIMQFKDGSPDMLSIKNTIDVFEFLRKRQDYCFRGTPIHQAALLLSTYDRNREAKNLYSRNGYEKIMGMTALLCDVGQSLEIVCEHTLEKYISEYKMIVIPELYKGLEPNTVSALIEYAKSGGNLVLVGKNTCRIFAEAGAPFTVTKMDEFFGDGQKAYDNGGDNGHGGNSTAQYRSYFFTLDGEKFGALFSPCQVETNNGRTDAFVSEGMNSERYSIAVTVQVGKGRISAIGFDIGSQYLSGEQYLHRTLAKSICDSLYTPMVRIENACGRLEIVPLRKDGKTMLQLINANGNHSNELCATDDCIPPVLDVRLSVATDKRPQRLILRPENKELDIEYKDGRAYFEIGRIDIHSIVEICE